MKIHWLQHVPFEGLGTIEKWAMAQKHSLSVTRFAENAPLPGPDAFDFLVVMGGPMNIYEEDKYPWLAGEKLFIGEAVEKGKVVLGICLGAQLLADVLGGKVFPNEYKEIGWHPIELTEAGARSEVFGFLPPEPTVFHWHGDTFSLPDGALRLASSRGCANQAFAFRDKVVGLQFHLESTKESIRELLRNCGDELVGGKYIQTAEEILSGEDNVEGINEAMSSLLDRLAEKTGAR
jgi:GMP synthase (glutamine-hydrolysing)